MGFWADLFGFGKIRVRSRSDPGTTYSVHPVKLTCSCPDWFKRRSRLAPGDPRRLCKHLLEVFLSGRSPLPACLAGQEAVARICHTHSRGFPLQEDTMIIDRPGVSALAFQGDDPAWWNVIIEGQRYGFNAREGRWSYGQAPPAAEIIARAILGNTENVLPGSIITRERVPLDKSRALVSAEVEGVPVRAEVSTRAKWHVVDVGGITASLHVEEGRTSELDPRLAHLVPALLHWLRQERHILREAAEAAQEKRPPQPRPVLSPEERNRRSTERARERRAKEPTKEVLAAYRLVESLLKPHLPSGTTLEPRDLAKYYGVGIKGRPAWVCRLHYKTRNKAVEFPDGKRLPLAEWEDLRGLVETLRRHCR